MFVPHCLHGLLLGPSGSRVKKLIDENGGANKVRINLLRSKEEKDYIAIKAHSDSVPSIKKAVNELIASLTGFDSSFDGEYVQDSIKISRADISRVTGRGNESLKEMQTKFGVFVTLGDSTGDEVSVEMLAPKGTSVDFESVKQDVLVSFHSVFGRL